MPWASSSTSSVASGQYAIYALVSSPGSLPWGETAAWLEAFLGGPIIFTLFALLLLLFPDGRPPSHRWRAALWLDLIAAVLLFVGSFKPGPMETSSLNVANPFGIEKIGALLNALSICGVVSGPCAYRVRCGLSDGALSPITSRGASTDQVVCLCWRHHVCRSRYWTVSLVSAPSSPGVTLIWPVLFFSAVSTIPVATGIAILGTASTT